TPPASFDGHDLSEVRWIADFPNQTCPTSVRRNHEGISLVARFGLEIGDLAKCETIDIYVVENDETVVHGRTVRAGDEGWFGRRSTSRRGVDRKRSPMLEVVGHCAVRIADPEFR